MLPLEAWLLGAPQVSTSRGTVSFLPDKRYQLLAYLAYQGEWVNRDELAYLFWSDTDNETARHSLRQLLKRLKLLHLSEALEIEREKVRWQTQSDVSYFKQALANQHLDEALELYSGAFLQGLESDETNEFHTWLGSEREALHTRWRETVLSYGEKAEAKDATVWLQKLLEHDPLDEEAFQAYLSALAKAGQTREAMQSYERFAKTLELELGLEPTSATEQLHNAIQSGAFAHSQASTTLTQVTKPERILPTPSSALIGRELELSDIAHLFSQHECRLLTLTGTGGVGKTRLALQVAYDLAPNYADGVYFVPLESLNKGEEMFVKIAELLAFKLQAKPEPLEQFIQYLQNKSVLLVLDNFEHLMDRATLVAELVQKCPSLKVIVTSRERLNLEQEQLLPVQGLPIPEGSSTLTDALSADGARLFLERAKRVRPEFAVTEQDLPYLIEICQRLEGIPLALELAAVWVRVMPLAELSQELANNLDLLESQSRDRTERHRSIRAAFDHSWNLLNEKEQEALRKLSVFQGGFTREAARLVANASVALLAALVDKSLLRVLSNGRYDKHPLLYQYAQEKLAEHSKEETKTRANHANYFLALAERAEPLLQGHEQMLWFGRLDEELDNLREALNYLETNDPFAALRLATALGHFWNIRGHYAEGSGRLTALLAKTSEQGITRAKALFHAGRLNFTQGDHPKARVCYEQSLDLAKNLQEKSVWALALMGLGQVNYHNQGDSKGTRSLYEAGLGLARESGDKTTVANIMFMLGAFEQEQANYQQSKSLLTEAESLFSELGNRYSHARVLNSLANVWVDLGEPDKARLLYLQSLDLLRAVGDKLGTGIILLNLGNDAGQQDDEQKATAYYEEGLRLSRDVGDKRLVSYILVSLGKSFYRQGNLIKAKTLLEESLSLQRAIGETQRIADVLRALGDVFYEEGNLENSYRYYQESLTASRENEDRWAIIRALNALAEFHIKTGDCATARPMLTEALQLAHTTGDKRALISLFETQAKLEATVGEALRAVQLLAQVETMRQKANLVRKARHQSENEKQIADLRKKLGEKVFAEAWLLGQGMQLEQIVSSILSEATYETSSQS